MIGLDSFRLAQHKKKLIKNV